MNPVNPVPDETRAMSPYLIVKGASEAIAFYAKAFGATELYRLAEPSGKIGHAELEIGHARFMLADEYPDFGALGPITVGGSPVSIHLYVADVDKTVESAVAAGARLMRPVTDEFFGDRVGLLTDPFGHKWHLASRRENVSPEDMQKRMTAAT
jgi:PhnB protein